LGVKFGDVAETIQRTPGDYLFISLALRAMLLRLLESERLGSGLVPVVDQSWMRLAKRPF